MRCKSRRCPSCGILWAGDSRTRILTNLVDGYGGSVDLVTITAPGRAALETDDAGQVLEHVAHAWNETAPAQWSHMWRRLSGQMKTKLKLAPNLLTYSRAYQDRGMLHVHLVFGTETPAERWAVRKLVQLLKSPGQGGKSQSYLVARTGPGRHDSEIRWVRCGWASKWGFGFVDHQRSRGLGAKALASYLAKYICKIGKSGTPELAETVAHPDVPKRPLYIARTCTARTRCTMRNLRLRRYFWRAHCLRRPGLLTCAYAEDLHGRLEVVDGTLRRLRSTLTRVE
jgi:hypothetical protein